MQYRKTFWSLVFEKSYKYNFEMEKYDEFVLEEYLLNDAIIKKIFFT